MPELPEVETIRQYVEQHSAGKTIEAVRLLLPRLVKNASPETFIRTLTGVTIENVSRKGKYLFLHVSGNTGLLIHLRMTGSLLYQEQYEPVRGEQIIFSLNEGCLIYRDIRTLGCLWLVPAQGATGISGYDTLGPDGNSPAFTEAYLRDALAKTKRSVKTFLLDQTRVAGLGNIYTDEALFHAHILPQRPCYQISPAECHQLYEAIGMVLNQGLRHGGTTIRNFINGSGKEGENQKFLCVYGREGLPCRTCGTVIAYTKLGGRGTHYCPHCQK